MDRYPYNSLVDRTPTLIRLPCTGYELKTIIAPLKRDRNTLNSVTDKYAAHIINPSPGWPLYILVPQVWRWNRILPRCSRNITSSEIRRCDHSCMLSDIYPYAVSRVGQHKMQDWRETAPVEHWACCLFLLLLVIKRRTPRLLSSFSHSKRYTPVSHPRYLFS